MSDYKDKALVAKKQLDNISPTMCYAKWAQVSMHLTNGMTHSCYHPPAHKINLSDLQHNHKALHNTKEKALARQLMLEGKRPEGCSYCWKIEDSGGISDRVYRSGEDWAQNSRKDIIASTYNNNMNPRYVEVNFNQACNFKCSYCSPHLSTAWETEVKTHGAYDVYDSSGNKTKHNDIAYLEKEGMMPLKVAQEENPYLNAFWQWWPELYKTLEVFRMTGGEPLMDSNTFKVLDYVYENPNAWLELSITSNFCPPREVLMDKFINCIKKIEEIQIWKSDRFNPGSGNNWYVNMAAKHVALFISVDGVGQQAEYIRNGLDFEYMDKNVNRFLEETSNTTITFINTFNILSVFSFKEYLEYILNLRKKYSKSNQGVKYVPIHDPYNTHPDYEIHPRQRIWFDVPLLRNPEWQCVNLLPKELEFYMTDAIDFMERNKEHDFIGFYDFEIDKVRRNLDWIRTERDKQSPEHFGMQMRNLKMFTNQHDVRRGTDFNSIFPELTKYLTGVI